MMSLDPAVRKRRRFKRLHAVVKAKADRVYDCRQVSELYEVSQNTVPNWIKHGLTVIRDGRRILVRGDELNRFHRKRRKDATRPCVGAEIYCVRCHEPRLPRGLAVDVGPLPGSVRLRGVRWTCATCGKTNVTSAGKGHLKRLRDAGVQINQSVGRGD